jgi:magnesium transporter
MDRDTDIEKIHQDLLAVLEQDDARLAEHLSTIRVEDVAEVLELLDDPQRSRVLFALDCRAAAQVIVLLDERVRDRVVEEIPRDDLARMVDELPADDAADVFAVLSEKDEEDLLGKLSQEQSQQVGRLLAYSETSAGGLMDPAVVRIPQDVTVGQAIESVRRADLEAHEVGAIFVTDEAGRLRGAVTPAQLLVSAPDRRVTQLMDPHPMHVDAEEDQVRVLQMFHKYGLTVLAVTDEQGQLLGQITVDDVMDVAAEEAKKGMFRMAGTDPSEEETTSVLRASRVRLGWLLPSFLFLSCSAALILLSAEYFGGAERGALVAFVPMIGAMAGCCSVQTATVIIRGLATGELAASKLRLAVLREAPIALIMAPACAAVAWVLARYLLPVLQNLGQVPAGVEHGLIAHAVALGMLAAIVVASLLGLLMPFFFRRMGIDPAIAAGPMVTAANDVVSVSLYFVLAYLVMYS